MMDEKEGVCRISGRHFKKEATGPAIERPASSQRAPLAVAQR
jgi:hypothetical protein